MTPLWKLFGARRALDHRVVVKHPGGPGVVAGTYTGTIVHVDRFPSRVIDSVEIRLGDGTAIHVPGGTLAMEVDDA